MERKQYPPRYEIIAAVHDKRVPNTYPDFPGTNPPVKETADKPSPKPINKKLEIVIDTKVA